MRRPSFLLAGLLAVPALALATGSAAAATNCDEGREAKGCSLPAGASYQAARGRGDKLNFRVVGKRSFLGVRSSCAYKMGQRFVVKEQLKVGKSYSFKSRTKVRNTLDDGRPVTVTYIIRIKVTLKSARRAVSTGTATAFQPSVPPAGASPGEDQVRLNCKLGRTLKRVAA